MDTVYLVCAILGGTVLVLQTLLQFFGGDVADLDVDDLHLDLSADGGHDAGHASHGHDGAQMFFKVLTVKTLVAFVAFFGLAGKAAEAVGSRPSHTLLLALLAGSGAFVAVYYLGRLLVGLQNEGNSDLGAAVGTFGEVTLPIGGAEERGKVVVHHQGRRIECDATSDGPAITTGTEVQVLEVLGSRLVRVQEVGNPSPTH